jgi:hypothetical protein
MGKWVISIVGESLTDDLAPAIADFVTTIQKSDHVVSAVRVTTDTGEKVLPITPVEAPAPAPKVIPGLSAPQ